jgi:hypothetical protein
MEIGCIAAGGIEAFFLAPRQFVGKLLMVCSIVTLAQLYSEFPF